MCALNKFPHNPLNRSPRAAFSLVEILVGLAILCLLSLLVNQVIMSTTDVVGSGRRNFEVQSKARAALDLIARDITQAVTKDVPAFTDQASQPALAFFTRRSGSVETGGENANYRPLSYVVYTAREQDDSTLSLWRGSVHVQWSGTDSYPTVNGLDGPMPFSNSTLSAASQAANAAPTLEPVLDGIARMEMRFLGDDGQHHRTFNTDPDNGPVSKAVVITLLVVDDKSQELLSSNTSAAAAFHEAFVRNASLPVPDTSQVSLGGLWEEELAKPEKWSSIPPAARSGIATFERTIPLR